jgi:predicted RNase H-like HicB family nuclease
MPITINCSEPERGIKDLKRARLWQNKDMKRPFAATVWREGDWYVSQCLEVDVASQGMTEEEALANLQEALELHFEPPQATRPPRVHGIEVGRLKPG